MDARTHTTGPQREIRYIDDDDDPMPIEEWTLDEIDSDFDLSPAHELRGFDAAFD